MRKFVFKTIRTAGLLFFAFLIFGLAVLQGDLLSGKPAKPRLPSVPVPVLMYHNIGDDMPDDVWTVTTDDFRKQINDLKQAGYTSILPGDLFARKPLPDKPVIITFDDGCLGVMTEAEPVLRDAGFRAIAYIVLDAVADTPAGRRDYRVYPALTWEEINAMRKRGVIAFGAHSVSHPTSAAGQIPEIAPFVDGFRKRTGTKPLDYAYPHGQSSDELAAELVRAGFRTAVVCDDKIWNPAEGTNVDLMRIPRVSAVGGKHDFDLMERLADEK